MEWSDHMSDRYDVSVLECKGYADAELDAAFAESARLAGFPDIGGLRILVKPNVLSASPGEKAITTDSRFVAAAIRFLKARGAARVMVGDSPAVQNGIFSAKTCGILAAVQENGAEWVDFAPGEPRAAPEARLVKKFVLASVLDECDMIVSLPKLKTHRLMYYTGAVKNFFGLIPGLGKSSMHMRFPDTGQFGTMLVDLVSSLPRNFTFMDGIVAMQGEGPANGTPYKLGLVFAGEKPAAIDWIAAGILGYEPRMIPYLLDAFGRAGYSPDGAMPSAGPATPPKSIAASFEKIPMGKAKRTYIMNRLPGPLRFVLGKLLVDRPKFTPSVCIGCGACARICPGKALALGTDKRGRHVVRIDDSECITCFCCHEVCPVGAIRIGKVLTRLPGRRKQS